MFKVAWLMNNGIVSVDTCLGKVEPCEDTNKWMWDTHNIMH